MQKEDAKVFVLVFVFVFFFCMCACKEICLTMNLLFCNRKIQNSKQETGALMVVSCTQKQSGLHRKADREEV